MDMVVRIIAITIEVVILAAIMYAILNGVRLTIFDLGAGRKYSRVLAMVFLVIGSITVVFFIAHLTTFYPGI